MELQHINVKLLVADPGGVDLEALIPIFHGWIQDQRWGELLLDVADYRHVPSGPGVMLIGHDGNYSVDNADGRLGVRYSRKAALDGGNQGRFQQATLGALKMYKALEGDSSLQGKLRFNGRDVEIIVNDRMLAPNTPGGREAVSSELEPFLQKLFAGGDYALSFNEEPRSLLHARVKASQAFSADDLSRNLASAPTAAV